MNEIEMLQIEQLRHHPENPRLDLGDLSELTASIKANGILQNLTVIRPDNWKAKDGDIYWVLIGNRRLDAAKAAGLTELPCQIVRMGHTEQIATMLQENMQRSDLTVYEQAKGIQMMLDLGFTKDQVVERTGFSRATVDRRMAVASLPETETKNAVSLGYDLMDLVEISKIEDKKTQEDLLKGTPGRDGALDQGWLRQRIKSVLNDQERQKITSRLLVEIRNFAKELKNANDRWSNKYEQVRSLTVKIEDGAQVKKPEEIGKVNYYYYVGYGEIEIYRPVKREKHVKTDAELALEKKQHDAKELNDRMRENRVAFVSSYSPNKTQETQLKARMLEYVFSWKSSYNPGDFFTSYHSWSIATFRILCGMPAEEGRDKDESLMDEIRRRNIPFGRAVLAWMLCGGVKCDDRQGYASQYNGAYQKDRDLDDLYTILTDAGYILTEEEQQWKDGSHPFYQEK